MKNNFKEVKPFIRYVGGKNWYLNRYKQNLPIKINNYYEPFLGSGSIFFHLKNNNYITSNSFISDINIDLITTFKQIKYNATQIIEILKSLENSQETFYKIRALKVESDLDKAIRYLYLNRTGFGGIYRVNQRGEYNVPYGNRQYKVFIDEDNIKECSRLLQSASIHSGCFTEQRFNVEENDFFCLDPPYLGESMPFNRYNEKKFGDGEITQILDLLEEINFKHARFILFVGDNIDLAKKLSHLGQIQVVNRTNNLSFSKKIQL